MIKISPSSNPCNEDFLIDYAKELESYGIEYIHMDVMDGEFVENKCLSVETIKGVAENARIGLDIHLMVKNPEKVIDQYLALNPTILTIHYEAFENKKVFIATIKKIKDKGVMVGVCLKPATPFNVISPYMTMIDLVLIMTVEPGKSGQKLMPEMLPKIAETRDFIDKNMFRIKLEVDGGVNLDTANDVIKAGADMLVIGSAFYLAEDRAQLIKQILAKGGLYQKKIS